MALRRRIDKKMTSQEFFTEVLHTPMPFPGSTVRMESDSLIDQRQRPASANVAIGELYHENSKLFSQMLDGLRASRVDTDSVRAEFVARRAAARSLTSASSSVVPRLEEMIRSVARAVDPKLFYAVQLRVSTPRLLMLHEPVSGAFELLKQLSHEDWSTIQRALRLTDKSVSEASSKVILFVTASLARNEALFGRRGYRRTLLEVGQVLQQCRVAAQDSGISSHPYIDFADREIDGVLDLDGVEESTFVALEIMEDAGVGQIEY